MPSSAYFEERLPLIHSGTHRTAKDTEKKDEDARYVMVATGFMGFMVLFSARASFGVAIVAMVNSTSSSTSQAPEPEGDFSWDETTQGVILGAYFCGYFWPQMLCGQLAHRVGGRWVLGVGLMGSTALNLLIPVAARAGVWVIVLLRALQGVAEVRGTCVVCVRGWGVEIGTVLGLMTAGALSQYGFAGGWPSIFYLHGILGCVLGLVWLCLVRDSPAKHPRITAKERDYIGRTLVHKEKVGTPWRHIVTSPAVWAVNTIHLVTTYGFTSVSTMLPTYMSNILHLDIEKIGLLSSLPFVAQLSVEIVGSVVLDLLHNHGITRHSRKLFNTVGKSSCGVLVVGFYVAAGWVPEGSPMLAVTFISLAVGSSALCVCTLRVAHLDIAPRFAGTLYGLTNTFANVGGFVAPTLTGALTQNQQTVEQWRIFFYINAGLYVAGVLVFLLWGRGEEQEWAKDSSHPHPHSYRRFSFSVKREEDANSNKTG
ncbi:hypothetical protein ACOMHN_042321 [Nucella lapillus]